MTKISQGITTDTIQMFQEQRGIFLQPNQLAHHFRWFYPHLEVAKKEVEVQIIAGQFFQINSFIETFTLQININDCMLKYTPGQLAKFAYNYYQHILAQNFEDTLQRTAQYFQSHFQPSYMILYTSDEDSYISDSGEVQLFTNGHQYNMYYVYFLLLIFMKSLHSRLSPKHFLEFDHPKSPTKRQAFQEAQGIQTEQNKDEQQEDLVQISMQNVVATSPIHAKEKQLLSGTNFNEPPKQEIILGKVSQFTELPTSDQINRNQLDDYQEQLLKQKNLQLKQVQNNTDQLEQNHEQLKGSVHDNYDNNGSLLLINNSRIIQLQNENLLLKKQLSDYHQLKDEIEELKGILNSDFPDKENKQLSTAGAIRKLIAQLNYTKLQLEQNNTTQNCLDSLQEKIQELQITNNTLSQQNANFKNIIQEKTLLLAQLQNQKEQLEQGNRIYEANLRKLKNETDNLIQITVQKNMQLINTNKNLQQQVIELQSVIKANSQQVADEVKNNSQEQQNIVAKYQQIIADKDKQISDLQRQVLESQYAKQQLQFIDTKQQAIQNDYLKQKELLYNQLQRHNAQNKALKEKLMKQKENTQMVMNQCQTQQNYVIKQQQQIKNLIANYKNIYTQHANLLALINNDEDLTEHQILVNNATQNQYNKQCVKYVQLQSQFKALQQQNQNFQNIVIELQDQLNKAAVTPASQQQSKNAHLTQLQARLEEINIQHDEITQEIDHLSTQQTKSEVAALKPSSQINTQDVPAASRPPVEEEAVKSPVQTSKEPSALIEPHESANDFEFSDEVSVKKSTAAVQMSSTEQVATKHDEHNLQAIEVISTSLSFSNQI